jgi:enterobactin synthetase component D
VTGVVAVLEPAPLLVALGPGVVSAGFKLGDHAEVIAALRPLVSAPGLSETAVPKRQAEFLAGRYAATRALSSLGIEFTPGRDAEGRPLWPAGVAGSITHGAGRALSAVAHAREVLGVGIDSEQLMSAAARDELFARICSPSERSVLAGLEAPEPARVTFAFSAKESLYKCLFPLVGRFMDFDAARVIEARGRATSSGLEGELRLLLSVDWAPSLPRGRTFRAPFVSTRDHVETAVLLRPDTSF